MPQNCDATPAEPSDTVHTMPPLSRLRDLRMRRALSQYDLADKSKVARTTIIRLEQGDPNVKPSTLRKLAKALRVKPAELFGE